VRSLRADWRRAYSRHRARSKKLSATSGAPADLEEVFLRSRSRRGAFAWLVSKEWRELMASPAWWVLLAITGPLVGVSSFRAVSTYSEISEGAGTALRRVCSPLMGVWAPTFAAYEGHRGVPAAVRRAFA
jgi:hypothetical protein